MNAILLIDKLPQKEHCLPRSVTAPKLSTGTMYCTFSIFHTHVQQFKDRNVFRNIIQFSMQIENTHTALNVCSVALMELSCSSKGSL